MHSISSENTHEIQLQPRRKKQHFVILKTLCNARIQRVSEDNADNVSYCC